MGDRIGVVNQGELIQVGTPHEIYNQPLNTFVASARRHAGDQPARRSGWTWRAAWRTTAV